MSRRSRRWIQGAVHKSRKGLLHFEMGVPEGEKIPRTALVKRAAFLRKGLALFRPGTAQHRDYRAALARVQFALNVRR